MKRIVMLGPPGAGKGTQGTRLASYFGVPHVASGDLLRRILANEPTSELAAAARVIREGRMVTDEVAGAIILYELADKRAQSGFVLDGYPRNTRQAAQLDAFLTARSEKLDAVVALDIDEEVLVARLMGRLTCPNCGESYNRMSAPPRVAGICDRCGTELTVREDDRPEAIHTRFRVYRERTAPLFDYYSAARLLREVDAEGTEDEVFARCVGAVGGEPVGPVAGAVRV